MIFNYLPVFVQTTAGSFFNSKSRVMVFIDGSNFYHSLKLSFGSAKIDFPKFCQSICEDKNLIGVNYYTSPVNQLDQPVQYKAQQTFLESIRKLNKFNVFLGRLEKRPNGVVVEKGVDVKLAVDLLASAFRNDYDAAIIVSNDSDFVPAICEAQKLGKKVINISFPNTKSFHLNKVCDKTLVVSSNFPFKLGD